MSNNTGYSNKYSGEVLLHKLKKYAVKIGVKLVYVALLLYYTLQKENIPLKAKAIIIGSLGYFIAPLDIITDLLPLIGYSDDFGVLLMALATVAMYIDNEVKNKAQLKLRSWFGTINEREISKIHAKL